MILVTPNAAAKLKLKPLALLCHINQGSQGTYSHSTVAGGFTMKP